MGTREIAGVNRIGVGMRESYKENLANHFGLKLYTDGGKVLGVATTEVYAGNLLSSEITRTECRHGWCCGNTVDCVTGKLPRNDLHAELSVGLVLAEAREGQLEQKRCYRPDKPDGVLRTRRFVSVAANCGPAGKKPAETSPLVHSFENGVRRN